MSEKPKRPGSVTLKARLFRVWVDVTGRGVYFKFHEGAGVGLTRDNSAYYETIGRWFCAEVEAMSLEDDPYTPPGEDSP